MPKVRTLQERLHGAAVFKSQFRLRGRLDSPEFLAVYPGLLVDLDVTAADVDRYIEDHRVDVEAAARSGIKP